MKAFRIAAVLLLAIYGGLVFATNFHSHTPDHDPVGLHCKLCQVSHITLGHGPGFVLTPDEVASVPCLIEENNLSTVKLTPSDRGRAPPLV